MDSSEIYFLSGDFLYDVYTCSREEHNSRHPSYEKTKTVDNDVVEPSHLASVEILNEWFVTLLLTAPAPRNVEHRFGFLDTLHSWAK